MSKVQRYDLDNDYGGGSMVKNEFGEYVEYEAYENLEAEKDMFENLVAELQQELQELKEAQNE